MAALAGAVERHPEVARFLAYIGLRWGEMAALRVQDFDLRHTAASLAVSAGANVKAVQRMLGHAKASMTLDVYADLFDEDLDSVAANLDAAIKSAAYPLRTHRTP